MQINELSYKITALNSHIHQNDYNMANTAAAAIIKNCEMILSYFYPTLQNILWFDFVQQANIHMAITAGVLF